MKKVIIALHGLGNKPQEPLLRESWLNAVYEGLERLNKPREEIPFEMVYWADLSYPEPLNPEERDSDSPLFLDEPYTPSQAPKFPRKRRRLYMSVLEYLEDHLDKLFLNKELAETFPGASTKMMEHFFSDLDTYYSQECSSFRNEDCSAKAAIQTRLRHKLKEFEGYEILLLSHSMGSIIAFDVLCAPSVDIKINTFVTMGSPLGLPPIVARNFQAQQILDAKLKQPKAPDCVWPHWYNVSDGRDTVALDHTLRDDYQANQHGLRAVDLLVNNDYRINGESNPHKSFGYLRTQEVAQIIDTFLSDRSAEHLLGKCNLILGNIGASSRRFWKRIALK